MSDFQAKTGEIQPAVSLQASVATCVNFASHQCDIAVLTDLRISNSGDVSLEDLSLELSADPPILGSRVWNIDRMAARSEFHLHDRRVTLSGGLLDSLSERMRAEIVLRLRRGEVVLAEAKHPIIALARNEWGGAATMPELLAAFVLPNDPAIQRILRGFATALIDAEGPITFKVICDRLARAHGFQRTGPQIESTVWAACRRVREHIETPDGHKVFWPEGVVPQPSVEFRGLGVGGTAREWSEVPYPEKVWLVQAVWDRRPSDPVRVVAEQVGVRRVTEQFRAEIERISRTLKLD